MTRPYQPSEKPVTRVLPIGLKPMHIRPPAGARIVVHLRDGRQVQCSCTMVVSNSGSGIIIYHKRKAINEMSALGWWHATAPQKGADDATGT